MGRSEYCETEVRDLFQGPVRPHRTHHEDSDDQDLFDLTNYKLRIAAPAQPTPPTRPLARGKESDVSEAELFVLKFKKKSPSSCGVNSMQQ